MTRRSSVLCALSLVSAPLAAQTRPSPNLFLTVFGGVSVGHDLWRIERQPLCVITGSPGACGPYDTLALARRIGSSLLIGVGASYFRNPYFGFDASPYLRAGIGLIAYSGGTVEMDGDYVSSAGGQPTTFSRAVIVDPHPKTAAISVMYALGLTSPLGPGYQFRLELRDAFAPLDRVTGPANDFGLAPQESRWYHHWGLAFGLDVVLEQKRGRRY